MTKPICDNIPSLNLGVIPSWSAI